jgi:hypothetical protein
MKRPAHFFTVPCADSLPVIETLLVPFTADGVTVGTVWLASHDESCRFDREDLRLLMSLSECASLAYRALARHTERSAWRSPIRSGWEGTYGSSPSQDGGRSVTGSGPERPDSMRT